MQVLLDSACFNVRNVFSLESTNLPKQKEKETIVIISYYLFIIKKIKI